MEQVALEGFLKKHGDVPRTLVTAKNGALSGIVSSLLTNFTKNPNSGAMGVLNAPLAYTITYSEICTGDQIKYCRKPATFLKLIYFSG